MLINVLFNLYSVVVRELTSSATAVLSSVTLHTYRGLLDWQNLVFMTMHEAGETNLLPVKSYVMYN